MSFAYTSNRKGCTRRPATSHWRKFWQTGSAFNLMKNRQHGARSMQEEKLRVHHSGITVQTSRIIIAYWIFMVMAAPATMDASARKDPSDSVDTPVMP